MLIDVLNYLYRSTIKAGLSALIESMAGILE